MIFTNVKSGNVDATTVKAGDLTVTGKTQLGNLEVRGGSTIDMGGTALLTLAHHKMPMMRPLNNM
ncbi:Uncharacterised protein [Actinobacillus equuli]|nr:Uncharacterised protein [Actinobacillus equuli]